MNTRKINLTAYHIDVKGSFNEMRLIIYAYSKNDKRYELNISMPWGFSGYLKRELNKRLICMRDKFQILINES